MRGAEISAHTNVYTWGFEASGLCSGVSKPSKTRTRAFFRQNPLSKRAEVKLRGCEKIKRACATLMDTIAQVVVSQGVRGGHPTHLVFR